MSDFPKIKLDPELLKKYKKPIGTLTTLNHVRHSFSSWLVKDQSDETRNIRPHSEADV